MVKTGVSWADAALNFLSWNCTPVSAGCKNCYALNRSKLYGGNPSNGGHFTKFPPKIRENAFAEVRRLQSNSAVFVNDHSDTFHEGVKLTDIQRMFSAMHSRQDVIWLVLTKRPERALQLSPLLNWTDNIWLGTSVENMKTMSRIPALVDVPAGGHFLSAEPLLEPLFGISHLMDGIDWLIVGGESGDGHRPFDKAWARHLRDVCQLAGVPFYFKQGSGMKPDTDYMLDGIAWRQRPVFKVQAPLEQRRLI